MNLPHNTFYRDCLLSTFVGLTTMVGIVSGASQNNTVYKPLAGRHVAVFDGQGSSDASAPQEPALGTPSPIQSKVTTASTCSSFLANWKSIPGATGYRIDVATDRSFAIYVAGYRDLDVGSITSRIVTHLEPGTTYYYRARPYDAYGIGGNSETLKATTAVESGLVINPTFDASITGDPNAAAIESAINQAIALYQSLFADPVTIEVYFRYANTQPDGTPFGENVAQSNYVVYDIPWTTIISSLAADSKTSNDATAGSSLPIRAISANLSSSAAGGRAIGLDCPPAMFADGHVATGGPYDGIVSLNSSFLFQFTRPPNSAHYDAQTVIEHETDEVLGLGSFLNNLPSHPDLRPQDLFSWSAPGVRNYSKMGTRYFSIDNGNSIIVDFSQDPMGDLGDWLSQSCPQLHPYVQNAFGCKGQFSDVTASSPEGVNLDVIGYDLAPALLPPGASLLANISTRGLVQTGDEVLIGGFIVTGTQSKEVIVRAIGPSIPLSGVLADPVLELHDASSALIASNDNWRTDQESAILATGVAPTNDGEAAIVATLAPGAYTAVVSGSHSGIGIGLVEVYDLDQTVDSKLANISTRGFVGNDDNVLIGGFIVLGNNPAETIVRAIGPSLTGLGVSGALQEPELELHDSYGTLIVSNDDWRTDQESDILATGIAPDNDAESAIVKTLAPGAYTAIVSGKSGGTGVALVEIYGL